MEILVSGATGFLGTQICEALKAQGKNVIGFGAKDCDLTDQNALDRYNGEKFDQIYHLAAWTQAGDFCLHHPGEQWIINQRINTHMLAWWRQRQSQAKLICIGTSCAYDPNSELEENNYLRGEPIESLYTYAMTKRMLYVGLKSLQKQFGMKYLHLVPSTLFGTGYHLDGRQMHFIFDLVRKIIRAKLYADPVVLWGDGHQRRELVLVDDFARLALQLADTHDNDLINIGAGAEHSIRYFAQLICEIVGYDFNAIRFDETCYVGARSKCLVVDKIRRLIPDYSLTPLEVGLRKTIYWFWENRSGL